jgi:hypothetical protein
MEPDQEEVVHPNIFHLYGKTQIEQHSEAWYALREDLLNPVTTGTQLHACFSEKAMSRLVKDSIQHKPFVKTEAIEFGNRMEPVADWMYERIYRDPILKLGFMWHEAHQAVFPNGYTEWHDKVPNLGVSPDGITPRNEPVEHKCVHTRLIGQEYLDAHPRSKGYKPPARYLHQLSGALEVLNCPYGYLCEWAFDEEVIEVPKDNTRPSDDLITGVVMRMTVTHPTRRDPNVSEEVQDHLYVYEDDLEGFPENDWESALNYKYDRYLQQQEPNYESSITETKLYRWWYRTHVRTKLMRFPQWWPKIVEGHKKLYAMRTDPKTTTTSLAADYHIVAEKSARTEILQLRARTQKIRHQEAMG